MTHDLRREEAPRTGTEALGIPYNITWHYDVGDGTVHDYDEHYHFADEVTGNFAQVRPLEGPGSLGEHVYLRNHHNIGCCMCAKDPDSITDDQIESAARLTAELIGMFAIPLDNVVDHVHWADLDGYGPNSGDPNTRVDFNGTAKGREVFAKMLSKVPWYREKLKSGELQNSLLGKIN